jgi:hypothetical protein
MTPSSQGLESPVKPGRFIPFLFDPSQLTLEKGNFLVTGATRAGECPAAGCLELTLPPREQIGSNA